MANRIDDYFHKKFPGLSLIQNPKKVKRAEWYENKIKTHNPVSSSSLTNIDKYKLEMISLINDFNYPTNIQHRLIH